MLTKLSINYFQRWMGRLDSLNNDVEEIGGGGGSIRIAGWPISRWGNNINWMIITLECYFYDDLFLLPGTHQMKE